MSKKITIRILLMSLFAAIVGLITYTSDIAFFVDPYLKSINDLADNRETINSASFKFRETSPIVFGEINKNENAYLRLKLRFRVDSVDGYPNIFQSAPVNRGIRMEISGSTAAIIVPDIAVASGVRGFTLTTDLKVGRWYILEVEALNGAFVRALLDGQSVANYAGTSFNFETTEILVGGGFDDSRPFTGEIKDISLIKGNLSPLPHRGLMLVYASLAAAIGLFSLTLWIALSDFNMLQKFVGKLALLALPLIICLLYSEYRLSFLNSIYYTKRIYLEQQLGKLEVLVMGSSNTVYGIAPEVFSRPGFNISFLGNGMLFDARLLEKYSDKMPKLRLVVLTVNYFTLGLDYDGFSQSWRRYFLRQNFNIPAKYGNQFNCDLGFWLHPSGFSKIALYGDQAGGYIGANHSAPVDIITSSSGWFDSGRLSVGDQFGENGLVGAISHNSSVDVVNYEKNLRFWEQLINNLRKQNIAAVIVELPTDVSYYGNLDTAKVGAMKLKLNEFSTKHAIKYFDYSGDVRFNSDDFTWDMPDHMNARGAMKLGKIIDEEVIKPQW